MEAICMNIHSKLFILSVDFLELPRFATDFRMKGCLGFSSHGVASPVGKKTK
jgi:hypothetical protein